MSDLIGKPKVQQWEYHRLYLYASENIMDKLYSVGERGWELVSIVNDPSRLDNSWAYFKRPKTNPS